MIADKTPTKAKASRPASATPKSKAKARPSSSKKSAMGDASAAEQAAAKVFARALDRYAAKDWGKLDEFQRKEKVKEYKRKLGDLEAQIASNGTKEKVIQVLLKQKAELYAEY
jgi:predicted lipid-binding transport protein (Tim44 family)